MSEPTPVAFAAVGSPPPRPLELAAQLDMPASRSSTYTGDATASGRTLTVADLRGFAWWSRGGRLLLNRGGRRYQGLRGVEDVRRRRG